MTAATVQTQALLHFVNQAEKQWHLRGGHRSRVVNHPTTENLPYRALRTVECREVMFLSRDPIGQFDREVDS